VTISTGEQLMLEAKMSIFSRIFRRKFRLIEWCSSVSVRNNLR